MAERRVLHLHKAPPDRATIYCNSGPKSERVSIEGRGCSLLETERPDLIYRGVSTNVLYNFQAIPHSPIPSSLVGDVGKYDFLNILRSGHLITIFTSTNHKFKAPKPVRWYSKPTADGRAFWIADESEILWKEEVIDLLGGVSQFPQWEFGMRLLAGK